MKKDVFRLWKFGPTLYFFFLVILNAAFPWSEYVQPVLFLAPLFFWAVYSPPNLFLFPILIISFFQDMLHEISFGVSAAEWFLLFYLFSSQKNFWPRIPFVWHWGSFGLFLAIDTIIYFVEVWDSTPFSWSGCLPSILGILMTFLLYPLLTRILFYFMKEQFLEN